MVDVNPEEWDAMRRGKVRVEEMSELDKSICGANTAKHLIIPMADVYNLRRIAGILHGLASDLDMLSRQSTWPARTIILETRARMDEANAEIKKMTGKGKRPKPWDEESNDPHAARLARWTTPK